MASGFNYATSSAADAYALEESKGLKLFNIWFSVHKILQLFFFLLPRTSCCDQSEAITLVHLFLTFGVLSLIDIIK
jgi:hypothetical protein